MMRVCQRQRRLLWESLRESYLLSQFICALLNFFTLTFRALGAHDVMSEMECAQLHSELFRRRHNTRQSHGLFALAKYLFCIREQHDCVPWKAIFMSLPVYALIICNFARSFVFYMLLTNQPTYINVFNFSLAEVSELASIRRMLLVHV